ncbi:MAG: Holliday junction resolvase RecU [Lachnospiraceae bacterium]|nr:Holliday junction resolvase RecU [Lachnospiraceae bacterium]MBO7630990.1 Holliday junction resolvase RecU [Lachnospiraceae bacterium]
MPSFKSRGLRGSFFEELINETNEYYRDNGIALVHKIPTPITPIEIDKESKHITLAYFDQVSTVDYVGVAQGVPICFDCKECVADTFPLQNVHAHQVKYMKDFEAQGGIAFLLIYYTSRDIIYYMNYPELAYFYERQENGGRKSIRFEELNGANFHRKSDNLYINYLEYVNDDLEKREQTES